MIARMALLLLACYLLQGQPEALGAALAPQSSAKASGTPTRPSITATTRMVVVDVVATDKKGRPVQDLTRPDFTVLEDGRRQGIAAFSYHHGPNSTAAGQGLQTPVNVYSNRPALHAGPGPVTVVLIDALNTSFLDQAYARREVLRYMAAQMRPGDTIAVVGLASSLAVLQDFTQNPQMLRAAVEQFSPKDSRLLEMGDAGKLMPAPPRMLSGAGFADMISGLRTFYSEQAANALTFRATSTLAALRSMARALAGYPGRKNLVWVTGSFPLDILVPGRQGRAELTAHLQSQIRKAVNDLMDAKVAVYAVDARGLTGSNLFDASKPGTNELGYLRTGPEFGDQVFKQGSEMLSIQEPMQLLADGTGGRVFVNRNDLDHAIASAVADADTYYTLAYYPSNKNWDGQLRRIKVKVSRGGVRLHYRGGYYATDPKHIPQESPPDLRPNQLPATQVVFDARITSVANDAGAGVRIEFRVDPATLSPKAAAEVQQKFNVGLHAAAFREGKLVAVKHADLQLMLSSGELGQYRREGLPYTLAMNLPPGSYEIILAVEDNFTGRLGTLRLPLGVIKSQP